MKLSFFKENKIVKDTFFVLTVILGFIFVVSFSALYVSDAIKNNNACGCVIPIPYMILILSSLGLFVGSLSSYILISKHMKEKTQITKNIEATLKFLPKDERKVIEALITNDGELSQSAFEKITGLHKVKVFRIIDRLASKDLITKTSNGKSNRVNLVKEIRDVFN